MTLWKDLLSNVAIVAVVVQLWSVSRTLAPKLGLRINQALFGLLFGLGTISLMNLPFRIGEGVFIDLRAVFVGLAVYFGGLMTGGIVVAMAMAQRLNLGGDGATAGIIGIGISALAGMLGPYLGKRKRVTSSAILGFAVIQAVVSLAPTLLIPGDLGRNALSATFPEFPLILFVATAMSGLAMAQELRWRHAQKLNATYKAVISALPDCLNVKDASGRFVIANPATAHLMQAASEQELIGKTDFDFYPRDLAEQFAKDERTVMAAGEVTLIEQTFIRRDGSTGYLETLKSPFRDENGKFVGLITHNRDVTEKRKLQADYLKAKEDLALAMENMADALVSFAADGTIQFCNSNYAKLFPLTAKVRVPGVSYRDVIALSFERGEWKLKPGESLDQYLCKFEQTLTEAGHLQFKLDDGRWIEAQSKPQPDGSCLMTYRDITASKKTEAELVEVNEKLEVLATTDGLTGLRNRRAFDLALREATEDGRERTVLMADIDHFKAYNDCYGHPAGDEVLKAVASCLEREVSRVGGFSARYGGEELAAILPFCDIDSAFDVAVDFREAVEALGVTHECSRHGVVSVSVGISSLPGGTPASVGDLLKIADQALYAAKAAGRNSVRTG